MSDCNHDCANCSSKCESEITFDQPHKGSKIKKVIGVVSGKGGVGKSLVTALLASKFSRLGHSVGVLDADITGPSVPKMFGVNGKAFGNDQGFFPLESRNGVKVMSSNLLLDTQTDPVIWRGPVIAGLVRQFWTDCVWGEVDYMFVDMPPGTGDVPLTVFQSIKLDGIIIVSSPQELVGMIVQKAVKMAEMMNIKVLGIVENFAFAKCPNCSERFYPFGTGKTEEVASQYNIPFLGKLPIRPDVAQKIDAGDVEAVVMEEIDGVVDAILKA